MKLLNQLNPKFNSSEYIVKEVIATMQEALTKITKAPVLDINAIKAKWMQKIADEALKECYALLSNLPKQKSKESKKNDSL